MHTVQFKLCLKVSPVRTSTRVFSEDEALCTKQFQLYNKINLLTSLFHIVNLLQDFIPFCMPLITSSNLLFFSIFRFLFFYSYNIFS